MQCLGYLSYGPTQNKTKRSQKEKTALSMQSKREFLPDETFLMSGFPSIPSLIVCCLRRSIKQVESSTKHTAPISNCDSITILFTRRTSTSSATSYHVVLASYRAFCFDVTASKKGGPQCSSATGLSLEGKDRYCRKGIGGARYWDFGSHASCSNYFGWCCRCGLLLA